MNSNYTGKLAGSFEATGTTLCIGLDPIPDFLPDGYQGTPGERIGSFLADFLDLVAQADLAPSAFKPNAGFYHALDRPRDGDFSGSRALATTIDLIRERFPGTPITLDSKRGDIARSSLNYAIEAFDAWGVDSFTASPYMGDDSLQPLFDTARESHGGVYVLAVTSNPGAVRFQSLVARVRPGPNETSDPTGGAVSATAAATLYRHVADAVIAWHAEGNPCGAVVGATHPAERDDLLGLFGAADVPVLIPGVGSQGGSAAEVMAAIRNCGYPPALARVNVSSGITHPWKSAGAPADWKEVVVAAVESYREGLS